MEADDDRLKASVLMATIKRCLFLINQLILRTAGIEPVALAATLKLPRQLDHAPISYRMRCVACVQV